MEFASGMQGREPRTPSLAWSTATVVLSNCAFASAMAFPTVLSGSQNCIPITLWYACTALLRTESASSKAISTFCVAMTA